jgi:hypothetical protein
VRTLGIEELIAGLLEKSVLAGAFMYMLHYFLTKQEKHQDRQTNTLVAIGDTLAKVSITLLEVCHTLETLGDNMESMDRRIQKLEERGVI